MGMMSSVAFALLGSVGAAGLSLAIYFIARGRTARRATPGLPPSAAKELARADQLLAADQISQAEYQVLRNRILGLPSPEPR
jgi:hypothetical protein